MHGQGNKIPLSIASSRISFHGHAVNTRSSFSDSGLHECSRLWAAATCEVGMNIPLPRFFRGSWVLEDMINLPIVPKESTCLKETDRHEFWEKLLKFKLGKIPFLLQKMGRKEEKNKQKEKLPWAFHWLTFTDNFLKMWSICRWYVVWCEFWILGIEKMAYELLSRGQWFFSYTQKTIQEDKVTEITETEK